MNYLIYLSKLTRNVMWITYSLQKLLKFLRALEHNANSISRPPVLPSHTINAFCKNTVIFWLYLRVDLGLHFNKRIIINKILRKKSKVITIVLHTLTFTTAYLDFNLLNHWLYIIVWCEWAETVIAGLFGLYHLCWFDHLLLFSLGKDCSFHGLRDYILFVLFNCWFSLGAWVLRSLQVVELDVILQLAFTSFVLPNLYLN